MGKVYVGQTDLTIQLQTNLNLTGATKTEIVYKDPHGDKGVFPAAVIDVEKGILQYAVATVNDLKTAGKWTFWARVTNAQGLILIGEPATSEMYNEGF